VNPKDNEKRGTKSKLKTNRKRGEGGGGVRRGEMTQTMYAHVNK
jgi:hypothetical protein